MRCSAPVGSASSAWVSRIISTCACKPKPARPPVAKSFGKAKSVILLFLYGSPSQLETFDPKPDAPEEIRGELKSIRSKLPGLDVCELLPDLARIMDRVCVVRSMTHPYPLHGVAYATTGTPVIDIPMELNPRDGRHHPYIGSVVDFLERGKRRGKGEVPTNLAAAVPVQQPAGRRGAARRPLCRVSRRARMQPHLDRFFQGKATGRRQDAQREQKWEDVEPYVGIAPESRFALAGATDRPADLTLDRLEQRRLSFGAIR